MIKSLMTRNANLLFFISRAHAKGMTVGMPQMKLADVPGLIGRRPRHRQTMFECELMRLIYCGGRVEPPGHPNSAGVIVSRVPRHRAAARSLAVLAKKDFAFAGADAAKGRGIAPIPAL